MALMKAKVLSSRWRLRPGLFFTVKVPSYADNHMKQQ